LEARAKGGEEDTSKDEKNSSEEKNTKIFSNLLDRKVSIFSKKNAKSPEVLQAPSSSDLRALDEREWTIL
jgi:Rab3 GTPase-activating protein catalytic subunit